MINIVDTTVEDGEPVELFEFTQGIKKWYFTDGIDPIVYQSKTYVSAPIDRDEINQTDDFYQAGVKLRFPRDNEFAHQFIGFSPDLPTTMTLYRGPYPNGPFDFYWRGRIVSGGAEGTTITLECESVFTSLKRPGLRARYERVCRHILYGTGCRVNQTVYQVEDKIQSIARQVEFTMTGVTSGFPEGHFTGGIAIAEDDSVRFITRHAGAVVEVARPFVGVVAEQQLKLYPGCDHSMSTCNNKFNNIDNFGGFPYIPTKNPFGGSPIV